jgi:hypothetical protein
MKKKSYMKKQRKEVNRRLFFLIYDISTSCCDETEGLTAQSVSPFFELQQ